ncbi:MAG: ABC transporter ATP-binding protein [Clostridia bacterium]|nr:ABC transporter ATP-binding protein [Clostridia bacterium]
MIELKQVTKRYGAVEAVHDLSFSAPRGQIVGLLGQNGAGKTTTLNMLTGYFPPTSGQVLVDGMDMLQHPRHCKRLIGYLPEKPPLYDEMTVAAYLTFVCRLKEVARRSIPAHTEEIMHLCGLWEVRGRLVGHLSKGYRQRVGVAQALCGNPPVLVLDEPTVGLDPRQVVEIRELMRELGKSHTVIFSSHLLSEVQQLCQRVVMLHRGRLIREADMAELTGEGDVLRLRASIAMKERQLLPALKGLPCVRRVKALPTPDADISEVLLECSRDGGERGDPRTQLFRLLCALDAPLHMLAVERDNLEDVFLRATSEDDAVHIPVR